MNISALLKSDVDRILPTLFDILYENMSQISPTEHTYEEELDIWLSCIKPALEKEPRQILLLLDGNEIAGYFQYYVHNRVFMMEEIQFRDHYKGSGMFEELYRYLVNILPRDTQFVEAYAHKNNHKSQAVLTHLGLEIIGTNKNGICWHFRGDYEHLIRRYGINA